MTPCQVAKTANLHGELYISNNRSEENTRRIAGYISEMRQKTVYNKLK